MDFRHVRALIAVAEEASISRAAVRLHISQPPLSRLIRQLEDELGTRLFLRHRHGVTLTDGGRRVLDKARLLSMAADEFRAAAADPPAREDVDRMRIGIGWGLWEAVNRARVRSMKRSPGVTIEAKDIHCFDDYIDLLKNRKLDVVFARPPFDLEVMETTVLFQERLFAMLSEDSPFASRKSIRLRELAGVPLLLWDRALMPYVYDKIIESYARAQVVPKMIPTPGAGPNDHAGMMQVASGRGTYICIGIPLTSRDSASGVVLVPVSDPTAIIDICVAWRRGEGSPIVTDFLDCVWQVFAQPGRATVGASRRAS